MHITPRVPDSITLPPLEPNEVIVEPKTSTTGPAASLKPEPAAPAKLMELLPDTGLPIVEPSNKPASKPINAKEYE